MTKEKSEKYFLDKVKNKMKIKSFDFFCTFAGIIDISKSAILYLVEALNLTICPVIGDTELISGEITIGF